MLFIGNNHSLRWTKYQKSWQNFQWAWICMSLIWPISPVSSRFANLMGRGVKCLVEDEVDWKLVERHWFPPHYLLSSLSSSWFPQEKEHVLQSRIGVQKSRIKSPTLPSHPIITYETKWKENSGGGRRRDRIPIFCALRCVHQLTILLSGFKLGFRRFQSEQSRSSIA